MKIVVKNLVVQYEDRGNPKGMALLFLHGWKNNLHTFDPIIPGLATHYRIIALDLPGSGGTEIPRSDWDLDDYVDFVDEFIEKIHVQVDVLAGHSLGGRVIIKGVAREVFHPKKIILIASAGIAQRKSLRNGMVTLVAKAGKAITAIPPFSLVRERLRRNLYQKIGSDYGNAGGMKGTFLKVIKEDLSGSASKITLPTLLIWGGHDTETPLADGKRLHRLIQGSKLLILPDGSHFVHREKPQEVMDAIENFLKND
jgi:pimeloyl-ACP methyl ester carboxylesterase